MSQDVKHTRYLVEVSRDLRDDKTKEIYSIIVNEADNTAQIKSISEQMNTSKRTVRRKVKQSDILERTRSTNLCLVSPINAIAGSAINVALSCDKANEKRGLPEV